MNNSVNSPDDMDPQAVVGAYFDALLHEPATTPEVRESVAAPPALRVVDTPCAASEAVPTPAPSEIPPVPAGYQRVEVNGLTLGIPAPAVAAVVAAGAWRPATASQPWVLGLYDAEQGTVTVVDTAALLMPEKPRVPGSAYSHLVLLTDRRWALACDAVATPFAPAPESVHWRGAQGKRPWLAGTVNAPPCALLDMAAVLALLDG